MGRISAVFGTHDDNTLKQLEDVASRAEQVALMADGHLGYVMPIGGVAAYKNQVSVVGVGFDIACGNAAIKTDARFDQYAPERWQEIADELFNTLSFGVGRKNTADDAPVDHALFESDAWSLLPKDANPHNLKGKARSQLGTIGSGNHYVDIFADETGTVWVGVHFGSRGLGHTIASGFLALSQGQPWGTRVPEKETLLDLSTPLGHDYWHLMELAGEYAYAGREWVARKVVQLLGANEVELVHNHHNFAWKEVHSMQADDGVYEADEYVVVRKGATPAFPGQRGFIGGSMGDNAVIVEGADCLPSGTTISDTLNDDYLDQHFNSAMYRQQRAAMYSTVHGAGRVMSRTAAAGKRNRKTGEVKSPGLISPEMMHEWLNRTGVVLRGGGLDEAPQAYRRLPEVLAAQGETITVLHTLTPIVVCMAGANEYDPYKD